MGGGVICAKAVGEGKSKLLPKSSAQSSGRSRRRLCGVVTETMARPANPVLGTRSPCSSNSSGSMTFLDLLDLLSRGPEESCCTAEKSARRLMKICCCAVLLVADISGTNRKGTGEDFGYLEGDLPLL